MDVALKKQVERYQKVAALNDTELAAKLGCSVRSFRRWKRGECQMMTVYEERLLAILQRFESATK